MLSWKWVWHLVEHTYYLLPLSVHAALPLLNVVIPFPSWMKDLLAAPIPVEMQRLHVWGWIVTPLIAFVIGSYCLDSKNSLCFFPGTPYFHRVLQCDLVCDGDEEEKKKNEADLRTIRYFILNVFYYVRKRTHF